METTELHATLSARRRSRRSALRQVAGAMAATAAGFHGAVWAQGKVLRIGYGKGVREGSRFVDVAVIGSDGRFMS